MTATPDPITKAACRWLLAGAGPGRYDGPDPAPGHDLTSLLSRERGNRDERLTSSAKWFHLEQKLKPVLKSLDHEVWAIKGFDLARSVYPFPGGRPMSDADLLVKPEHLRSVADTFTKMGWQVMDSGDGIMSSGIVSETKAIKNGVMAELHTHIFYFPATFPGRLPEDLTQNGRPLERNLMGLAWHNALLIVILHMITNTAIRPVWWADVCLLARKMEEQGTWREFTNSALKTRLSNPINEVLKTAAALGAPVPKRTTDLLNEGNTRAEALLTAIKARRGLPTLQNLRHLQGWKRISWFHAMLWLALTRQSPLRGQPKG
jgi:hypothetical protein